MTLGNAVRSAGCACGAVKLVVRGEPARSGLCHCLTCQKAHAAPFFPFVVFAREQVDVTGEVVSWESSPGYHRAFCAACGSRTFSLNGEEIELSSSSFEERSIFPPQYESWIIRRQPWLAPLNVPQHERNRTFDG